MKNKDLINLLKLSKDFKKSKLLIDFEKEELIITIENKEYVITKQKLKELKNTFLTLLNL